MDVHRGQYRSHLLGFKTPRGRSSPDHALRDTEHASDSLQVHLRNAEAFVRIQGVAPQPKILQRVRELLLSRQLSLEVVSNHTLSLRVDPEVPGLRTAGPRRDGTCHPISDDTPAKPVDVPHRLTIRRNALPF
jgi:hypothetical protein